MKVRIDELWEPDGELTAAEVEELLFDAASVFSTTEEQNRFLRFACRGQPELLNRIRMLLGTLAEAEDFFEFEPQVMAGETGEIAVDAGDGLGVEVGRYRLIERLGAGGCGVVYLAEQQEPVKRKVALKIIRLGRQSPEVVARFEAERQALASMNHPNIARVLDAGTNASGRPFFVMELVDGESITDYCDSRQVGVRERLQLFVRVCQAVQHAHQKGVVHRDLKPSNVLVETHESTPDPKVIDFGVALEDGVSSEGSAAGLLGTPDYMSPEQVAAEDEVDTRSDIYSLGVLLGELLAGPPDHLPPDLMSRAPEQRRKIMLERSPKLPSQMLASRNPQDRLKIARDRGTQPGRLQAWCERELDWLVRKAIHRDPDRRYQTATALAADILRWLEGDPVGAHPPSRRYRLAKLVSRNRLLYGSGALALAGLLIGLGTATHLFLREREARAEQEKLRKRTEVAHRAEIQSRKLWEFRSRVAEAAVSLRYGDNEAAAEGVAAIPIEETPASLESVSVFLNLAEWHRSKGAAEEAERCFLSMVQALSKTDRMHTDVNSNYFLPAAAAIASSADPERYEELRRIALDLYGGTQNRLVAERILKACLLRPASDGVLERTAKLAAVIEGDSLGKEQRAIGDGLNGWECFALGLHCYRSGQWEGARSLAVLSHERADGNLASKPLAKALLGLVLQHLGEGSEARKQLEYAVSAAGSRIRELQPYGSAATGFWYDWADLRILLEEAGWSEEEGWTTAGP